MDIAFKESMALYSDISAKNASWKKIYVDSSAFRRDPEVLVERLCAPMRGRLASR